MPSTMIFKWKKYLVVTQKKNRPGGTASCFQARTQSYKSYLDSEPTGVGGTGSGEMMPATARLFQFSDRKIILLWNIS